MDVNPYLQDSMPGVSISPGKGIIEVPGQCVNIVWQTRRTIPTEFENQLADALERVFDTGATSLAEVVDGLNKLSIFAPNGDPWIEATFIEQLKVLGQP